jgi:CheY-like chemotaxis protein
MRRKVLLADDSLSIQKMFGLYLEKCNIDVVAMSNGELAVSRLSTIRPDLILADVFMPGRTGYEVCEYVKQHPDFKHIPVLLLTGKFEPYDEKEAKRVRADGHIVKPIAEQEFVSLIRTTLERFPPKPAATPPPTATQPVGQTQVLGSVPPPATAKEPSGVGAAAPPKFHPGSLDPSAEVPPTIKVTPSMLASITPPPKMDDGRLPDLEPLLPLDAPPPSAPSPTDATDFILDLPPPEQAPPVLTYPEPPKTLSTPIPRPTFSSLPPPNIGTTTAKLDPTELPELFTPAVPSPPVVTPAPPAAELDSPLELDDAVPPVVAPAAVPEPQVTTSAAPSAPDEAATPFAVAPFTPSPVPPADVLTAAAPPAEPAAVVAPEPTPSVAVPAETPAAAALPDEPPLPSFEPVITPPTQVAQPWEQPTPAEPPITTAFQPQTETSSLPSPTDSLTTQPTSNLLNEPVPPPDFLTGLVSSPTAVESAPVVGEGEPSPTLLGAPVPPPPSAERLDVPPESNLVSFSTLPTTAPPQSPVFEVAVEEEPPVHGTDLLPDELVAMRQPSPAVSEALPVAEEITSAPTEADMPAAGVTTEVVATSRTEAPALEATAPPATDEVTPEASDLPAFVPTPPEAASLQESAFSVTPPVETEAVGPGIATPVDEPAVAEAAALPTLPPGTLTDTMAPSPAVVAAPIEVSEEAPSAEAPPAAAYSGEVQPEPPVETAPATAPAAALVAEPTPATPTAAQTVDWSTFTLPPAVVDEIVRRVVAEISDHVVREIAWEVVPDLAELLIKKHLANNNGRRNTDG